MSQSNAPSMARVSELLCNAFEGGSNYWCVIKRYEYPEGRSADDYKGYARYLQLPTEEGGAVVIRSADNDVINGANTWKLTPATINRGLRKMA